MVKVYISNYDLGRYLPQGLPHSLNVFEMDEEDVFSRVLYEIDEEPQELWGKVEIEGILYAAIFCRLDGESVWYVMFPFWKYPLEQNDWFITGEAIGDDFVFNPTDEYYSK